MGVNLSFEGEILRRYEEILAVLKKYPKAKLVAVSKRQPVERLKVLYDAGHRDFGENYFQEWCEKKDLFPEARWHFIGKLQSKKVKPLVELGVHCIQSIGSDSSLKKLNQLEKEPLGGCFLQVNLHEELQKGGFEADRLEACYKNGEFQKVKGLMSIPAVGLSESESRKHFVEMRKMADKYSLEELSMGMSGDWEIALEEGATIIRLGTAVFGNRDY